MLKKRLIINTKINKNNSRYTIAALEAMQRQINDRDKNQNVGILGQVDETGIIAIDQVAFTYEHAVIEKEALYADITLLKTKAGKELKNLIENDFVVFRPVGNILLSNSITQTIGEAYSLVTINAILDSEDAVVI